MSDSLTQRTVEAYQHLIENGRKTLKDVPAEIRVLIDPKSVTLDELKLIKKQNVGKDCQNTIYAGIDVTLSDESVEHFSLTEKDQINLFGKQAQIASGSEQCEYHSDGSPCKFYSAEDMTIIINAAMSFVSYQTTYCNALNMWIAGCKSKKELEKVSFGAEIPQEYHNEVLDAYISQINEG